MLIPILNCCGKNLSDLNKNPLQKIDDLASKLSELANIVASHGMALKIIGTGITLILGAIAASSIQFLFDKLFK